MHFENLIIGTGFVGYQAFQSITRSGGEVGYFDASLALTPDAVTSSGPEYSTESLMRNATPGGGAHTWGGKVTRSSNKNWFKPRGGKYLDWELFGEAITSLRVGNSIFDPNLKKGLAQERRPYLKSLANLPGFTSDIHLHLTGKEEINGKIAEWAERAKKAEKHLDIRKVKDGYEISFEDQAGERIRFTTNKLFLCSGTIGNALLLGKITNQSVFPLGNHAAAVVAGVKFLRRKVLIGLAALAPWGVFRSWSFDSQKGFNHSFRMQPISTLSYEIEQFISALKSLKFRTCLGISVELFLTYVLMMPRRANIFSMLDTGLHSVLRINNSGIAIEGSNLSMGIEVHEREYLKTGQDDLDSLTEALGRFDFLELEVASDPVHIDTHHYFGTCPMLPLSQEYLTVDENFEVRGWPGLFSLGSSAFPIGSHGHPTLLAIRTAEIACSKFA